MKRRTTKRRTIKTRRRTIKTRRRTIKRRPRKIMVGGEETPEVRKERKMEEAKRKEKETHEERTKRVNLDEDRNKEGKEIIENLREKIQSSEKNTIYFEKEEQYKDYIRIACINKIVEAYGLLNNKYKNKGIKFNNEFIPLVTEFGDIKKDYPLVYLSYRDKKDNTKHIILKDELPFIWPWDWDDYIMSFDFFKKFNDTGEDYDKFILSTEYKNALYEINNRFNQPL